jgi:signal transduction histidine kinase
MRSEVGDSLPVRRTGFGYNRHSLFWKLSSAFLALLLLIGGVYTYLTLFSSEMYFAETSQRLNAALARHIVQDVKPFFLEGRPNQRVLNELFHNVMVVNPSVEVYLLDAEGAILAFDAPPERVKASTVSLDPVRAFLLSEGRRLVLGDNPRDAGKPRVFSAAPIEQHGHVEGYVYVILRGEEFDSIAERILASHILSLGLKGVLVSIVGAATIGLIALAMVTRKLHRLTRTALAFKEGDYSQRVRITSNDELDELGRAFNAMADTLSSHVEQLQHTDTLRRELIANVSHDLRTPLASMQGYLETVLMKESNLSAEERRKYLEVIFSNTERLGRLIQELFELTKLEAKQTQPQVEQFSLAELVSDLIHKFGPVAQKQGVSLSADMPQYLPHVRADIGMIDRVLQNLLDNAVRHTPSGGAVKVLLTHTDGKLRVCVEDTGHGIDRNDLPFVFDRFYQSRSGGKAGGGGLGLSIVKKILEAHGESVDVESTPGKGTRFMFSLPSVGAQNSAA